ncbi:site-specific integrase [Aerococcaceae bacterium DSM 111020]|nr:site-specific integrase [Aerococcaceae bacterium DSM 111020]
MSVSKDKRTGKWMCRVSYKDNLGKYKQKTKKGFDTKKEAQVYEVKLMEEVDSDSSRPPVLSDFVDEWIKTYKEGQVSPKVHRRYLGDAKVIREYFGEITMDRITRPKYQEFLNQRGKGRSKDTVKRPHYIIQSVVKNAMADGLITRDFTYGAKLTYDNKGSGRIKAWNYNDAMALIRNLDTNKLNDFMLYIAIMTGLRIGEIYALSYDDISDDKLSVRKGFDYTYTKDFTPGKNESSLRTILITNELYLKSQVHKIKNQKYNKEHLFLDEFNQPRISHTGLTKYLKRKCKRLGIDQLTIHSLRHTHCSILIYEGVDINYISKRLGHSSTVETIQTYSHILDEYKQMQDDKIENILNEWVQN